MKKSRLLGAVCVILSAYCLLSTTLHAATVTFYTDRAVFDSKLSSSHTIDFEGVVGDSSSQFASQFVFDNVTFTADGYSGSSNELWLRGKDENLAPTDSALLVSNYSFPLLIDLTAAGSGLTAIGGFFGQYSNSLDPIIIEVYGTSGILDVRNLVSASMMINTPSNFFGWIVEGDEITNIRYSLNGNYEGLDDLVFGVASPVPIPPALWLFGSGLLGLIGASKKKA